MDDITYRVLTSDELDDAYARLAEQGLLWALFPELESVSLEQWREMMGGYPARTAGTALPESGPVLLLGGFAGNALAGLLSVRPFMGRTQCGEAGVTALRPWFPWAARLSREGFLWAFEHLDCVSLVGRVAAPNRHILRMAESVGFRELGRIPGMCWHARKRKFVDGVLLLATPETVRESMEPRQEDVEPRSAAEAFSAQNARRSESRTGRAGERHGEEV
ncbi:MAG: hypothetical protein J1E80_09640 [Desulfovibrionaceae bacterium]|nr:hypothetical protein [Desulfovibrionaceae bacterium]